MSDLETTELGEPLRSSSEVLTELKRLRQREGISARRIKTEASALTSLVVVSDQMAYRGFNPADRHLGAYTVVGCVIDHEVRDLLHRQILRISLSYRPERRADTSFHEAESIMETQQMNSLESRDLFAQAALFLTKNPYEKHREQAYQELADGLVMSQVSPCRESQGRVIGSIAADLMLETILGLFSMEAKDELRDKLAREVIARVPGQLEKSASMIGTSPSKYMATELLMEFIKRYEADRNRRIQGAKSYLFLPLLEGKDLIEILVGRDDGLGLRLLSTSRAVAPDVDAALFLLWFETFYLPMYSRSVRLLAKLMLVDRSPIVTDLRVDPVEPADRAWVEVIRFDDEDDEGELGSSELEE